MISTIKWRKNKVRLIDQTKLPHKLLYRDLGTIKELWRAIRELQIRGAPAIGIAAAFGIVLGMNKTKAKTFSQFIKELDKAVCYLKTARPTAVNLFWALERMKQKALNYPEKSVSFLKKLLFKEAMDIMRQDKDICRKMAAFGAGLIKNNDTVLTHCNAGALATADYGTALGVFYAAKTQGKKFKVYADETRPVLQGARLTAWELMRQRIDVTLICDNMAGQLMSAGKIDKIFVGADRIAANGDTANKIGTYSLAVLARYHKVPFYVVAPRSTFDLDITSGKDIPIEQRPADEVRKVFGCKTAPANVKVYNPAFDVTPNKLITAIITEKGILKKPFLKYNKMCRFK